jgi:hypothetical protein
MTDPESRPSGCSSWRVSLFSARRATTPTASEQASAPGRVLLLHATGTGSDGSEIRFTIRRHFVLDKRTGEDRCNSIIISTCRVS